MSFAQNPANVSAQAGKNYVSDPAAAMRYALQQRGLDPTRNFLAKQMLGRANELTGLATVYGAGEDNFLDFANQFLAGQMGGGNGAQFTNAGIRQNVSNAMATPSSAFYNFMTDADPNEQWQRYRAMQAQAQAGMNPYLAQANMNIQENQFGNWKNSMLNGWAGVPQNWLDAVRGPGAYVPPPPPPVTGTPGVTPPGGTAPGTTPPAAPGAPATPGTPAAPAPGSLGTWDELMRDSEYGRRSWSTKGGTAGNKAFNIGGVRYDPTKDLARQYDNMSGKGETTNRGAAFGVFMYRLDMLRRQKANALAKQQRGEPLDQYSRNLLTQDDNMLARSAVQFVNERARGNTGFSIA